MTGPSVATAVAAGLPTVAEAMAAARAVTRARAKNFYYGLRLTPEPKRSALYAVYAWTRMLDDAVDGDDPEAVGDAAGRLGVLEQATELTMEGRVEEAYELTPSPAWVALGSVLERYPVRAEWMREMIAGMRQDLGHAPMRDVEEFEAYCYRVASTVGLICVSIWGLAPGVDAAEADALAIERGLAFQWTNVLRDFDEDFDDEPRRVYVPASLFEEAGLTPADLRDWRDPAACEAFVNRLVGIARERYERSAPLDEMVDVSCRPTLWAMTRIYRGLLEQIAQSPRLVVHGRARLSKARKASIALRAWAQGVGGGGGASSSNGAGNGM